MSDRKRWSHTADIGRLADLTQGLEVTFPTELGESQRKLMDTLGVTVKIQHTPNASLEASVARSAEEAA